MMTTATNDGGGGGPSSAASRTPPPTPTPNAKVPFASSVALLALVAFLSPLASFVLRFLYVATDRIGDSDLDLDYGPRDPSYWRRGDDHRRSLQTELNCNSTNSTSDEYESADDLRNSTWEAIWVTLAISGTIAFLCLLGYELFRRDPIVGKYVYDRKRLLQPDRTPPPLMLSRSLWRGGDDDDDDGERHAGGGEPRRRPPCCRVLPAILEIVFLNLDPRYLRYSAAADEARKERERRGYVPCCRTGCFHNNCCNQYHVAGRRKWKNGEGKDEFYVDEDGYAFYPGYKHTYSQVYASGGGADGTYALPPNVTADAAADIVATDPSMKLLEAMLDSPTSVKSAAPQWQRDMHDLYPEDEGRAYFASHRPPAMLRLFPSGSIPSSNWGSWEEGASGTDAEVPGSAQHPATNYGAGPGDVDESFQTAAGAFNESFQTADSGVGVDVTRPLLAEDGAHSKEDGDEEEAAAEAEASKYPYRLFDFFLPPGFHSWANAMDYLAYFFFLSNTLRRAFAIPAILGGRGGDRKRSSFVDNPGKDLTESESEFLRCAGLETYLLVRMARFGFDVTFYPYMFALVAVLPVYYSCVADENNTPDTYFLLNVNIVPPRDNRMIVVVVSTGLLYLFILRRLWCEWEGEKRLLRLGCLTSHVMLLHATRVIAAITRLSRNNS